MKKVKHLLTISLLLAFSACNSPSETTSPEKENATVNVLAPDLQIEDSAVNVPAANLQKVWVFNLNWLALYNGVEGPEIGIIPFNTEMQTDSLVPGWAHVLHRGNYLWTKEGNLSDQKLAPWEEIEKMELEERYNKWFRDFGEWEEITDPYYLEYRIKGMDISRSRAYNLLKFFFTKEEWDILPRDLPEGKFAQEGENFDLEIATDAGKKETTIEFLWAGGVTTGKISAEKEGLQISISFSAD